MPSYIHTVVDEGDTNRGTCLSGEGGERARQMTPDLSYSTIYRREPECNARIIIEMKEKKKCRRIAEIQLLTQFFRFCYGIY